MAAKYLERYKTYFTIGVALGAVIGLVAMALAVVLIARASVDHHFLRVLYIGVPFLLPACMWFGILTGVKVARGLALEEIAEQQAEASSGNDLTRLKK